MIHPCGIACSALQVCTGCDATYPLSHYPFESRVRTGHARRCRQCARSAVQEWERRQKESGNFLVLTREYQRTYRRRHPDMIINAVRRRYARRFGAKGQVSRRDWTRLVNRFMGFCAYCRSRPADSQDHVVPLCKGGTHSIGNLLPSCQPCNSSKGGMYLIEWRRKMAQRDRGLWDNVA